LPGRLHDQAKASGLALVCAIAIAILTEPDVLFGWVLLLMLPPFFVVLLIPLGLMLASSLWVGWPMLFVVCGVIPAAAVTGLGFYAASDGSTLVALALGLSTFLPFALIQFVVALFKRPASDANMRTTP
jgi:hypothetical protein